MQRPQSSPALSTCPERELARSAGSRGQRGVHLPTVVLAEEDEFDDRSMGATLRLSPALAGEVRRHGARTAFDLEETADFERAAQPAVQDLSVPTTLARGDVAGDSFLANFRQVSLEGTKARGRYISTRHQLRQVKVPAKDDGKFAADMEQTKTEVGALMADLKTEFQSLLEVEMDNREIAQEVTDLVDNDAKLAALLAKMNRKLDVFQATLGNF